MSGLIRGITNILPIDTIVTISPTDFKSDNIFSSLPLESQVSKNNDSYTINFPTIFNLIFNLSTGQITSIAPIGTQITVVNKNGIIPVNPNIPNSREVIINFPDIEIAGDTYVFTITSSTVRAEILRSIKTGTNTTVSSGQELPVTVLKSSNDISIPILTISGQTLVDGSDIGDNIFTITDIYQYYCINEIPLEDNKCGIYYAKQDELKITQFRKCCPKIVSVVIGEGKTLYDKLENIFITLGEAEIGTTLQMFYPRIFFYAMLKYILARILYGEFNINFLLRNFNKKFLKDLGESRFCEALHIFLDPDSIVYGYDKYFRIGDKPCKRIR
jgi:hypothetical protein